MFKTRQYCSDDTDMWYYVFSVLTLSLPNATVVELIVHCQTRLQSKFKGTVDSCLFNCYKGHKSLFYISK